MMDIGLSKRTWRTCSVSSTAGMALSISGLSEGQAQRISIARALLHPCKVLLLDEATSALDMQTEKKLLENLKQHYCDCTIIFVTHRLAVVDFTTDSFTMVREESKKA